MIRYEPVLITANRQSEIESKLNGIISQHIGQKIHSITSLTNADNKDVMSTFDSNYAILVVFQYHQKTIKKNKDVMDP